jgi:acetyl esterase/lipase
MTLHRPFLMLLTSVSLASAQWIDLWPGTAPGGNAAAPGSEVRLDNERLTDIGKPQYQVYLPAREKATGAAAVILPGGGYSVLAAGHEGEAYAKWLAERGVAGILVKYRVHRDDAAGYQFPVPFLDARRAIRTARAKAAEWGIDPNKIGVMGSSAGGHLASLCATRFADAFPAETKDAIDALSCRPDFAILIYPVISMQDPLRHKGSRERLLGRNPGPEEQLKCSTDRAVTKDTPPVFLLTTSDDIVDCRNSLSFATACKEHGVPVSLHLFETGGHGYGLNGKGTLGAWPSLLETWLAARFKVEK